MKSELHITECAEGSSWHAATCKPFPTNVIHLTNDLFVSLEGYPVFEGLYKVADWGSLRIFEVLVMPQSLFWELKILKY